MQIILLTVLPIILLLIVLYLLITQESKPADPFLSAKIDAILEKLEIDFDPGRHIPGEVLSALRHDRRIEAIKLYRKATGTGLKEAKEFLDDYQKSSYFKR